MAIVAADLHIHIFEGITEADLAEFFSNTLGSKYFSPRTVGQVDLDEGSPWMKVASTPDVWVGEVSWLKAALFEDAETFVPSTVQAVNDAIGEDLPVIDDGLIAKVRSGFEQENQTTYELATAESVCKFLGQHRGKRVFTISH